MAISLSLLLPYVLITKKLKLPNKQILILRVLRVLFASDVAVWNIAIQNSSATQASLLVNLVRSGWVLSPTYSLTRNQQLILIGTTVALFGMAMLVGFKFFLN
jgi:hypothetical protein